MYTPSTISEIAEESTKLADVCAYLQDFPPSWKINDRRATVFDGTVEIEVGARILTAIAKTLVRLRQHIDHQSVTDGEVDTVINVLQSILELIAEIRWKNNTMHEHGPFLLSPTHITKTNAIHKVISAYRGTVLYPEIPKSITVSKIILI